MGVHCCCLHVKYTVYQHFGRSLHIESLDSTQVQNFRPASLTVFGIQTEERERQDILISCRCMLLFKNMQLSCKYASDGVSTWTKFDGHIYYGYPVICKSIAPL